MAYHSGNQLIDPYLIFEKVHLQPGMHVADLGCGKTGHVVFPAAVVLGERGIIYAVDIVKNVLTSVEKRAKIENFINIHTVWADIERGKGVAIPEHSLDIIFLVNVLYQSSKQKNIFLEAERLLKKKSRIVVVDWFRNSLSFAPDEDKMLDFNNIKQLGRDIGFVLQENFDVGKYHKGLVFYRHD